MARLQKKYREEVFPQLQKEFELTNPMQVPKISKITCNIGVGEASRNAKAARCGDGAADQHHRPTAGGA